MSDDDRIELRTRLGLDGVAHQVRVNLGQPYRLVLERPRARILQMEDVCFGTDRCLLLPTLPTPPDDAADAQQRPDLRGQRDGLAVIAATLAYARAHPQRSLLIAGHTDSVGSTAHNLELSQDRATNVLLYLQGDREGWAAHADAHFVRADFKRVHLWAHLLHGWDTDPGPLDESWNGHTKTARDEFRRKCEEELGVTLGHDVEQNEGDWKAIFDLYDRHLASILRVRVEEVAGPRGDLSSLEPPAIGCGEAWPVEAIGVDDHASEDNRRVDVLFFDPEEIPDDVGGDAPGLAIYGKNAFKPEYMPVGALGDPSGLADFELFLELRDHWIAARLASKAYEIRGPLPERRHVRVGTTDADGRLREAELSVGEYLVMCEGAFTVAGAHLTKPLEPSTTPDVHRLHGHGEDEPPGPSIEYADPWVVLNAGEGDFVEHQLDEDFDEEFVVDDDDDDDVEEED
ncbi:MAG: OmpA family protein [Nannocystales bacterium]